MTETLLSVEQAQFAINRRLCRFPAIPAPLARATGAVLAQTVVAERDQPPFDRVTMDGIAIAHAAWARGAREFPVQATQAAGDPASTLEAPGNCIEVMTGAVLPTGCDTVIAVERLQVTDGRAILEPGYEPAQGQFIHPRGSDYRQGSELLLPGSRIGVPEIAILAANGLASVRVAQSPAIAVISTGDEVVEVDQPVLPHQIRQSNSHAILAALKASGHPDCRGMHLRDDPAELREQLARALDENQVLVLSGGVSRGKFDFVPGILEELGVVKHVHRVAQRPGKPMWFGTRGEDRMVFALPGNPVSTLVCLHRYVLPALETAMGLTPRAPRLVSLAEQVALPAALACFLPVVLESDALGMSLAHPRRMNTSGDFASLAGTHGFVELPADLARTPAGFSAHFYPWAG